MIDATLFADGKKAVRVKEKDEKIVVRIASLMQAVRLMGVFLAVRRYGEESGIDEGKDVVVKYGLLKVSV